MTTRVEALARRLEITPNPVALPPWLLESAAGILPALSKMPLPISVNSLDAILVDDVDKQPIASCQLIACEQGHYVVAACDACQFAHLASVHTG